MEDLILELLIWKPNRVLELLDCQECDLFVSDPRDQQFQAAMEEMLARIKSGQTLKSTRSNVSRRVRSLLTMLELDLSFVMIFKNICYF